MSSLFEEIEIEVIKATFTLKSDGVTQVTYYFSQDFWDAGSVYTTNPAFYPLLASSPSIKRGVGINVAIKYDVSISLLGNSDFINKDSDLVDFLKLYEIHNSDIQILYYCKPKHTITTHSDSVNIRQTLKVVDSSYDSDSGILQIRARDVWFKNKEVSKKLDSSIFSDIDLNWDGNYGSIVFGQATTAANGIAIDAPFLSSEINDINIPNAKIFSGWTFTNHPNHQLRRLLVRNNNKFFKRNEWVDVELLADPQTAGGGDKINLANLYADPVSHDRDLSINERALVIGTSASQGYIATSVRAGLSLPSYDRCLDISSTQYLWNPSNPDFLSRGDEDFSFSFWAKFDTLAGFVCQQGWDDATKLEWAVFHDGSNHLQFSISSSGTSIAHSAVTATISTNTWYYITCVYDTSVNNKIYIYVNTTAVNTNVTNFLNNRGGRFVIGRPSANAGLDGKMYQFRYWRRALSSSDVSDLYNSGVPIFFQNLTDAQKIDLSVSWPLNEPRGNRLDEHGSADLVEGAQSGGTTIIRYAYSSKAITVDNSYGELSLEVYHSESLDGGDTYAPVGSILAKSTIDLTKTNASTSALLTTGTQNVFFQLDPPIVMSEFANFIFILKYSNDKTNTYYVLSYYSSETPTFDHMFKAKRNIEEGANTKQAYNKETAAMLDMQVYYLGDDDNAWVDSTITGTRYSYQGLEARTITIMDGMEQKEFNKGLEFKICIDGLEDDGSGTYTGSANALIQNPSDIIRFTAQNAEFGCAVDSSNIDDTSFTSVRTSLSNIGLAALKININSEIDAEELITEICKQSRIIFYKKKNGKLSLYFPVPITSYDYILSEQKLGGDFILLNVKDNDYSSIINEARQFYNPDLLNNPTDPSLLRREEREKLSGKLELTADASTMSDVGRQAVLTKSKNLYGIREMTFNLSFYDDVNKASKAQNYYVDRYSSVQKRVIGRLSRKRYLALELFNNLLVNHTGIESNLKTGLPTKAHYTGTPTIEYYEGVPVVSWAGGQIVGQTLEIEEQDSWITFTAETVSTFES